MSFKYSDIAGEEKAVLAHTGLSIAEFEVLAQAFNQEWLDFNKNYTLEGKVRLRQSKVRKNNVLTSIEDKLLFILFFYKVNPIQEELAAKFGLNQPQACNWLVLLRGRLLATLTKEKVIPKRKSHHLYQMLSGENNVLIGMTTKRISEVIQKNHSLQPEVGVR